MKKNSFAILMMIFLVVGCASPTTSSPSSIESQSPPVQLEATPVPSKTLAIEEEERAINEGEPAHPTSQPAATSEPALKTDGPYFVYFRQVSGARQLVKMDADGAGREVIEIPKEMDDHLPYSGLNAARVSPNGKWLAFYTGSAGDYTELLSLGTFDLTLNLLNLETGEKQIVTPLLSKDYPENFKKAAKQLNEPYTTPESLQAAFLYGITNSLAWSPDGQHLAFAGQMDGLSSDLYVYNVQTKAIRRLSSGDQELQWIDWSPDGKWILHGSLFEVGMGMAYDIYAAAVDGSSVRYLSTASWPSGWVNSHVFFEHDNQNGPGDYGLRIVDVNTGRVTRIWDGSFFSYRSDRSGKWVVVDTMTADILPFSELVALTPDLSPEEYFNKYDSDFKSGPYLINLETLDKTRIEIPSEDAYPDYDITSFPLDEQLFALTGIYLQPYLLSATGRTTPLEVEHSKIMVSPSSNYWIAVTEQEVKIFSADSVLIKSVSLPKSGVQLDDLEIMWSPDETSVFLIYGTKVYCMNILDDNIELVETNLIDNYGLTYRWIGGQ